MRSDYHTKQKEKIFDVIQKQEGDFTVKELHEQMKDVGLTTIYRLIEKLEKEGLLDKKIGEDHQVTYHYLETCEKENHFYLRCMKCGVMIHIDCDCIAELNHHILKNHQFALKKEHIIMEGLCSSCRKEELL